MARRATNKGLKRVEDAKAMLRDVINNPEIIGKGRADRIQHGRALIAFLQANMVYDLDTTYFNGDQVAYTGVTNEDTCLPEFIFLEGAKAGKYGVKARS